MGVSNSIAVVLEGPSDLEPLELADGLELWKEVIYEGAFAKEHKDGKVQRFSVDEKLLDHWAAVTVDMIKAGIEIPAPLNHDISPLAKRAKVVDAEKRVDSKGRKALYQKFKFFDEESADLARKAGVNVSLYSPPSWMDGAGRVWYRPIRHTALTDYPVIPDLDGWETLSLSYVEPKMSLNNIAKKLGITGDSDEALEAGIINKFTSLSDRIAELEKPPTQTITAAHITMLHDNRKSRLEELTRTGRISPATRDELLKTYCETDALELALSSVGHDDGFDRLIEALRKNEPAVRLDGKEASGPQTLELGDRATAPRKKSVLLADAEKRREKFNSN